MHVCKFVGQKAYAGIPKRSGSVSCFPKVRADFCFLGPHFGHLEGHFGHLEGHFGHLGGAFGGPGALLGGHFGHLEGHFGPPYGGSRFVSTFFGSFGVLGAVLLRARACPNPLKPDACACGRAKTRTSQKKVAKKQEDNLQKNMKIRVATFLENPPARIKKSCFSIHNKRREKDRLGRARARTEGRESGSGSCKTTFCETRARANAKPEWGLLVPKKY